MASADKNEGKYILECQKIIYKVSPKTKLRPNYIESKVIGKRGIAI
jgi:hypothetical protein